MTERVDHLARIVARKRGEVVRRKRRAAFFEQQADARGPQGRVLPDVLRRPASGPPRVISEIKLRSPSAGEIRARTPGELVRIGQGYQASGAAAISVLCDGP